MPEAPRKLTNDKLVEQVRSCFKQAATSEAPQRQRELEDLKIYSGDQWPDDVKTQRLGGQVVAGQPPVPPRPMLTVNIVRQPVRQILNQERASDLGVSVVPADDFSGLTGEPSIGEDEIELREGLIRRIQRMSDSQRARSWAFERCAQAGRGYWRVLLKYANEHSFDQEIYTERIWNQASVYLDPASQQPDGSDAKWAIITDTLGWDDYKRQFPDGKAASAEEFTSLMDEAPDWFSREGQEPAVKVAEYFYTDYTKRVLVEVETPAGPVPVWADEIEATGAAQFPELQRRTVQIPTIMWAKVNGVEVLEGPKPWAGRYIPVVKVVGEELQPYDTDRRVQGVVRPSIDSQRGTNYMLSAVVESIGLGSKAPYIATFEQIEGYEDMWAQANVRNFPVLYYNLVKQPGGEALPPPSRNVVEPAIQAQMAAYQAFREGVRDTTGIPEASLGNVDPGIKSGRAILALQKQSEAGTSNWIANMAQSVAYEGKIINDLLKPVYGNRPGRLVEIVTGNNDSKTVGLSPKGEGPQPAKNYVLTDGEFSVAVKVGRNYDTRREESSASMAEVFSAQPEMFPVYSDLFFEQQDWPGARQFAKRAKALLPPQVKQAEEMDGEDLESVVQQQQQQLAQASQMVEMLSKELQAKTQAIETDQVKSQADIEKERMRQSAETARKAAELDTDVMLARLKIAADLLKTKATLDAQQANTLINAELADLERATATTEADKDRVIGILEADKDRVIGMSESDADRQFQAEQAERQTSDLSGS